MRRAEPERLVLFEPWSLGDVIIAASVLREMSGRVSLACHPAWHPIVRSALSERPDLELIPVDLPYTTRRREHSFDSAGAAAKSGREDLNVVLSIRGDLRDYMAARRLFPGARIHMKGWARFLGRKSAIVNAPYAAGLFPVQNRYRSWAQLAGIPFPQIEQTYRQLQHTAPASGRVVIHVGAQWRSKQFPDVSALRDELLSRGWEVVLLAGPGDLLPRITEAEVQRALGAKLVGCLRSAEYIIANDSGPMHLAAFLGCRTIALVRASPIAEWAPPCTHLIESDETPLGYRPDRRYTSDETLANWPTVKEILSALPANNAPAHTDRRRDAASSV